MNEGGNKNTVRDELRVLTCVYTVYIIAIILLFILFKLLFTAETVACMPNCLYILLKNVRMLLEWADALLSKKWEWVTSDGWYRLDCYDY